MPAASRPHLVRVTTAALAAIALGGALVACSSGSDEPPAPIANPHGEVATVAPPTMIDPATLPADEPDNAAITSLIDVYFATTNAQDADGFRRILCAAAQPDFADIENEGPVPDPLQFESLTDIAVDGDVATAYLSYNMGDASSAPSETVPMKFTREAGEWKVCGSP